MPDPIQIPRSGASFIDERSGAVSREWFRFFGDVLSAINYILALLRSAAVYSPPTPVVVSASPFVYVNSSGRSESVVVEGGTVTAIDFTRDGSTFYDTGAIAGMFALSPGDSLRVTYSSVPAMVAISR